MWQETLLAAKQVQRTLSEQDHAIAEELEAEVPEMNQQTEPETLQQQEQRCEELRNG